MEACSLLRVVLRLWWSLIDMEACSLLRARKMIFFAGAATTNLHHKWLTKMELGFGIHKEPGAAVVDLQSVDVMVSHVLKEILSPV
ncbi:hypothetical protein KY284_030105 [Solanum tuberosum]|nr:hypothetical protein KY284_030105 [Solanum tuberosum]